MKRKLTKTEKTLTEKGIERRKKQISSAKENLKVYERQEEFLKTKREYEDYVRPFNRKAEDKAMTDAIEKLTSDIDLAEKDIESMTKHLKEGVEVTQPTGVN